MDNKYKGYCVTELGGKREHMPPVNLKDERAVWNYIHLQGKFFKEVIIENSDGNYCLHVVDAQIVFPKEISGIRIQ